MRVTVVMLCMNWGGAERVTADLVNRWAAHGWDVTLLMLVSAREWPPFYPLDPRVKLIDLDIYGDSKGVVGGLRSNVRRVRVLRRAIKTSRPDVVASFLPREIGLTYVATRGLGVPVIGCPHSDPSIRDPRLAWRLVLRAAYRRADRMVFQTPMQKQSFPPRVQQRSAVIPNPVRLPKLNGDKPELHLTRPAILAVGHLIPVKNHQLLLRAFANASKRFPEWSLTIVGEGELRGELEAMAKSLGISDQVQFPGLIQRVYPVMAQADIFAQPSLSEGFSMALCEAMSCGVPAVATDCSDGQRTIVRDGIDGVLVPSDDVAALTRALEILMGDAPKRKRMGQRAAEVTQRFSFDGAMKQWDDLVRALAPKVHA